MIREVGAAYSGHLLPGISNYNWLGGERGGTASLHLTLFRQVSGETRIVLEMSHNTSVT